MILIAFDNRIVINLFRGFQLGSDDRIRRTQHFLSILIIIEKRVLFIDFMLVDECGIDFLRLIYWEMLIF